MAEIKTLAAERNRRRDGIPVTRRVVGDAQQFYLEVADLRLRFCAARLSAERLRLNELVAVGVKFSQIVRIDDLFNALRGDRALKLPVRLGDGKARVRVSGDARRGVVQRERALGYARGAVRLRLNGREVERDDRFRAFVIEISFRGGLRGVSRLSRFVGPRLLR